MAEIINLQIKWEYKMMTLIQSEEGLNTLGQDGWELAGISQFHLIFKRPVCEEIK